jgi:anti-anti-sigma factor
MLTSRFDSQSNTLTFFFKGSLDTVQSAADAEAVTAALDQAPAGTAAALAKPLRAIFDLKAVDYVSSAFFRICLGTAKRVRQGNFAIVNAPPAVTQLLKIAGMDGFLGAL